MKKSILALSLFLPMIANASVTYISEPGGDSTNQTYQVKCSNGTWDAIIVTNGTVYASAKHGYIGNDIGVSTSANKVCEIKQESNTKVIRIKKNALVFKNKDGDNGILASLTSDLSYNSVKALVGMTDSTERLILNSSAKVSLVESYEPHTVLTDQYGNYVQKKSDLKGKPHKNKKIIDGYYKISDGSKIYYVRKSETE